jgi:hypothetical protein
MKLHLLTGIPAIALALAGCVPQETTPTAVTAPASADQAMVANAGLDAAGAAAKVSRVGYDNAVDAGLAVGMTQSLGVAGLGMGVLGMLASPGAGLEGSPHILITLPPGANPAAYTAKLSEAVYRASGMKPESEGYKRVQNPRDASAVNFIKEGCQITRRGYYDHDCSLVFHGQAYRPQGTPPGQVFMVNFQLPGNPDYEAFSKRVVDQLPNDLSLYLPPKKVGGVMRPASLYRKRKVTPL